MPTVATRTATTSPRMRPRPHTITPTLFLLLAAGGALLVGTPRRAAADPNNANCKPNRAACTTNQQCCSGACTAGLCVTPTTTTSTTTTSTTSTTTTTTTTSTTTTTTLRFVDNGDGTVTDNETGLQWEKKTGTVGTAVDCDTTTCSDPHDVNNQYNWSSSGTAPDGGAFTKFLNALNGGATGVGDCVSSDGSSQTGGFVNHCDWRLPTIAELRTIVDTSVAGCGSGSPCIDPTFGPTAVSFTWSSITNAGSPTFAWLVNFNSGSVFTDGKTGNLRFVRAVRGGS